MIGCLHVYDAELSCQLVSEAGKDNMTSVAIVNNTDFAKDTRWKKYLRNANVCKKATPSGRGVHARFSKVRR